MTYAKPEITVLGEAMSVIEAVGKIGTSFDQGDQQNDLNPAYDLDE
jgi:hypothetical protein